MLNPAAAYYWASEPQTIDHYIHQQLWVEVPFWQVTTFFLTWYSFFLFTYGTNLPAGLFSPGIIMGVAYGQMYYKIDTLKHIFNVDTHDNSLERKYMVIGCGAIISGYVRLHYSVGIILLEIGQDFSLFLPLMLSICVTNYVGSRFTRGAYHRLVRFKQMPILNDDSIPYACRELKADYVMNPHVTTFRFVEKLSTIKRAMEHNNHHAFPIVN